MVDTAADLHPGFGAMYLLAERPAVPPEKGLKTPPLQTFDSTGSIRPVTERIQPGSPFRQFAGLSLDIKAQKRKNNETAAKLSDLGTVLAETQRGSVARKRLEPATGTRECEAGLFMRTNAATTHRRISVGVGRGFDGAAFVVPLHAMKVVRRVAQNPMGLESASNGRTTCAPGRAIGLRPRKGLDDNLGWMKTTGAMSNTRHVGKRNAAWRFTLGAAGYGLARARSPGPGCT